jgi:hypothetical protein
MGWEGLDDMIARTDSAPARVEDELSASLDEIADELLVELRRVAPFITGAFRGSWGKERPTDLVRVVATRRVRYGPFVAYDHSGVKRILSQADKTVERRIDAALEV